MAKFYDLTKSSYTNFLSCPKMAWLYQHKREEVKEDPKRTQRLSEGNKVGEAAKGLLGEYVDVTERFSMGALDIAKMAEKTRYHMGLGTLNICEAAFIYDRCYCAADILHRTENGWDMYEVKSATSISEWHLRDTAYQKYLIAKTGTKIGKVFIVRINGDYVYRDRFSLNDFFVIEDVTESLEKYFPGLERNIPRAKAVILGDDEPETKACRACKGSYRCDFWDYCMKGAPERSVFDLYRVKAEDAANLYNEGIRSFEDVLKSDVTLSSIQKLQIKGTMKGGDIIDKAGIKSFLDTLWYPMYFLDFETFQTSLPVYKGQRYNQQIPFQYSLHYIEEEGGELKHKDFLAMPGEDPRRDIAESLVENIPEGACVLAYYMKFERGRIEELAENFPDLKDKLLAIRDNIRDLLDPFQNGYYYNAAMGASFSIKSVLPAVFPDNPELDYHGLEDIHNGLEATEAYHKMTACDSMELEKTRRNLLKYCELDTFAMVLLWRKLIEVSGEGDK
ncbi:MAG: DUF2779 domain-containing protein [Clostridia bacterium]|nr:DUF2779 domain-containing protein [Clostridia bacterium]